MSPAQTDLLQRLLEADRRYRSRRAAGLPVSHEERGVEVNWCCNGVAARTAHSLVDRGLAELVQLSVHGNGWLFLGRYDPLDPVAD